MKAKENIVGMMWGLLSFGRPGARAGERLIAGSIVSHEENLCKVSSLTRVASPWLWGAFSVLTELIDSGHVCVQPGDGGASL